MKHGPAIEQRTSDRLAFVIFLVSIMFLAFAYGALVGRFKIFPYSLLEAAHEQLYASVFNAPSHLFPIRHAQPGARTLVEGSVAPGLTLLTSYWPDSGWKPGIRLIDQAGNVLHRWDVYPSKIWPGQIYENDPSEGAFNNERNYVHGTWLFDNGDVLFNVEYLGMARMSADGKVLWRLDRRTHHSIARDGEGNFWVSAMQWVRPGDERFKLFPGATEKFPEDLVLKVSGDGKVLQELSVVQPLFEQGYKRLFWKYRHGLAAHLNDVEPLADGIAGSYPLFEAGDLVVSLRDIHTVYVISPATGRIKWLEHGELNMQHDPDFTGDGWVEVFDNNDDGSHEGKFAGGSRIVGFRPHTNERRIVYPSQHSSHFYTKAGGKKQRLANGNLLVTEAQGARVFEVDRAGRTVWQWIQQPYDSELVPEVLEGTRYEQLTAAHVAGWKK